MDIEAELLKSLSKEELEREIKEKIKSFHGLLTKEAALRLIARDKGLMREEKDYRLAEIPKGARKFAFTAHVKKVWPVATYSSGKKSRVVEIADDSGANAKALPLVLWNEDAELAKSLRSRDEIRVKGAYEKGGELHLGYSGTLEVVKKAAFSDLAALHEGHEVHIRGAVSRVEGHDSFVRDGRTYRGFSFFISDGTNERRCVVLEGMERAQKLKEGDEVIIEDAIVSSGNIDIRASTRILSRRLSHMLMGEVRKLECADDSLSVDVEGNEVTLDRENALRLMGVDVAPDIALSTVTALKKDKLLNNRIALRIEKKDGRVIIR